MRSYCHHMYRYPGCLRCAGTFGYASNQTRPRGYQFSMGGPVRLAHEPVFVQDGAVYAAIEIGIDEYIPGKWLGTLV